MRFGPQRLHHLHLFLGAAAAVVEVFVEPGELNFVPADSDPEPEPAAAQYIEAGRLFGDECGLALRQDQDAGREAEPGRAAGQKAEQHERVVKQIFRGIAVPARAARGINPKHVVGRLEKIVSDIFHGLREVAYDTGIAADIAERQ